MTRSAANRDAPLEARLALALRERAGGPVLGTELPAELNVDAAAVREAIETLVRRGFVLETHPHQGLCLLSAPPALWEPEIAADLPVERVGCRVRCMAAVGSTNDLAWTAADGEGDAADGLAVFAEHQAAGRGRRGNRWLSPPHASLLASVVLVPVPGAGADLTRAAAVAAAGAVEDVGGPAVGIKWPNDLVVDDRKVAGILVETRPDAAGRGRGVVGLGINCTQGPEAFPADLRPYVASLASAGGPVDRTLLARRLLVRLDEAVAALSTPAGVEALARETRTRCRTLGRRITLVEDGTCWTGEVVDLDPDYGLILRLPDGSLRRFGAMTAHVAAPGAGG